MSGGHTGTLGPCVQPSTQGTAAHREARRPPPIVCVSGGVGGQAKIGWMWEGGAGRQVRTEGPSGGRWGVLGFVPLGGQYVVLCYRDRDQTGLGWYS